ncbi:hypothetical protein LXA43DRAFT_908057 [Ganoderma leucocontextum]|nr:hypothetical protein LXA43DRAFT_908057 [Ganoderma leucocontextum]
MSTKPWDIYASQLFPIGYGHPLWMPEPTSTSGREVCIGDVGWLKEGEFRALFNSMNDADHPINQEKKVPRDFQVFCPPNLSIGRSDKITAQMVCSRSITANEAQAELAAVAPGVAPASAGVGWRFQTRSDSGALVMLNPPGVAEDIESKRHIVNYMRDNFDSWLEFANASYSFGLDLRPEDFIFICGTLKTTEWAVAAFQGSMFRNKEGHVSGQLGSFGNVGFSVHISNQVLPTNHYRTGPHRPPARVGDHHRLSYPGHDTPAGLSPSPNQCLFVHYYKMKRRLWWKEPMLAGAGPHQLPPGADNAGEDAAMVREGSPPYEFEPEAHVRDEVCAVVVH